jgi:hypothetical protein
MIKSISAVEFMLYLEERVKSLPAGSVIKAIGTGQKDFIIIAQDISGKEHKLYIPCEEN